MYQRILVPVDGSASSTHGLDEAIRVARLTGGRLRLMHLIDELSLVTGFEPFAAYSADALPLLREAGEKILADGKSRAAAAGVEAETQLFETLAVRLSDQVVAQTQSWPADLIVIGTHGRRGMRRLVLGSDAEQVLRVAPVPVLLVRAPDEPADPAPGV